MNSQELIYKLVIFFFANNWHFLELVFLIFVFRKDIDRVVNKARSFFVKVGEKYRQLTIKANAIIDLKKHKPDILNKISNPKSQNTKEE